MNPFACLHSAGWTRRTADAIFGPPVPFGPGPIRFGWCRVFPTEEAGWIFAFFGWETRVITIGTIFSSLFFADLVGTDEFGNRYYRGKRGRRYGRDRRWVIYKGQDEASKVPAEWHAWLHHTVEEPLAEIAALARPWQKLHQPNPTGTAKAYWPRGHEFRERQHAPATGDYEAWSPESTAPSAGRTDR